MAEPYDYLFHLVFSGYVNVGKDALSQRFREDTFIPFSGVPGGFDFQPCGVTLDNKIVRLVLWTLPFMERFKSILTPHYGRANGIMMVYDITERYSFEKVCDGIKDIEKFAPADVELMILGNKCDNEESRVVTEQEGRSLAVEYGAAFFETSAKSGQNVKEAVLTLARTIKDKVDASRGMRRKWHQSYMESLYKHGSVSVAVTQCILVGPPAVGKSSLKHLLVHNVPKAVTTSTAVMDTPEVVSVTSEQYAVEGGTSAWQLVDDDIMGKSLYECIARKEYECSELHQEHNPVSPTKIRISPPQPASSLFQKLMGYIGMGIVTAKSSSDSDSHFEIVLDSDSHYEVRLEGAADMLYSLRRHRSEGIQLKDAYFIHFLDTGGQPSFQEALPLLLANPSTYIQVFNAARDLDQPVPITYRPDDHTEEVLPPSAESGWKMMLRSFSSMQTMAHKCSKELASFQQEGKQLPQFRIFIVGNFKDQLIKEGRHEEAARNISERLRGLEGKPYYHCIKKDPTGQPFYLINSTTDQEGAYVNSLRGSLSSTQASFKVAVPLRWYICKQYTQDTTQKFFRFLDLKTVCLQHEFIDASGAEEQFRSLVKLFSLLGFYVFFDLKGIPDEANYICTDKGVFLKEVSKLLAVQFLRDPMCHAVEVFKQHGIISSNVEEIFGELGIVEELDRSWLLAALEHVGLLARYASATEQSSSYFMPAALPQGKTKLPDCSTVASLCVTFGFHSPDNPLVYTDLPRGIFCRLAVELSNGTWVPIPKESDRTTVKFHSEEFELYLTEAPGFISLTSVLVEELEGKEPLAELHKRCRCMYDTLHKSIIPSAEDVLGDQFSQTAEIVFGVKCCCRKVPHLATPATAKAKTLICQATMERQKCLNRERIWFVPVENAKLVPVDGCNMWVMEESGGPSSDSPQTVHLRQKVHAQQSTASPLERTTMSLGTTGSPLSETLTGDGANDTILSQNVNDHREHLMLFRIHVSKTAAARGRAVLEGVGLDTPTIGTCFENHPRNVVEFVQAGLVEWSGGQGTQPPTWGVLLRAMEFAKIAKQHTQGLKADLGLH